MVRPISLWSFTQPENITPQALSPLTGPHCVTDKSTWGLHVATFTKHQWDEFSVTCRVEQFLWIRILHKWLDWLIKIHLIILMCKSWRVKISSSNYFTSDQRAKQWRYSHSDITSSGTEKELLLYVIDTERFRDTRKGRNLGESSPATRHAEAAKYSESACRGIKGSAGTMTTTILLVSKSLLYPDTCVFFWLSFWDICIKEL